MNGFKLEAEDTPAANENEFYPTPLPCTYGLLNHYGPLAGREYLAGRLCIRNRRNRPFYYKRRNRPAA